MPGVRAFRDPLAAPKNKGLTNSATRLVALPRFLADYGQRVKIRSRLSSKHLAPCSRETSVR